MSSVVLFGMLTGAGALLYLSATAPYKEIKKRFRTILPKSWTIRNEDDSFRQTTFDTTKGYLLHPDYQNNNVIRSPDVGDYGVYGMNRKNFKLYPGGNVTQVYRDVNLNI
tara:strand:- start:118 stop:447 length:330 start_codon:yes stop_codon:yes gene_type:complete